MKRIAWVLSFIFVPLAVQAAVDPEVDQKYQLEVVVRCGSHNWLGEQFRDDLRSDLAGALQDALGGMADVTVVDLKKVPPAEWKPLWKDAEVRGLAGLDGISGVAAPGKTHFLRIDFVDGYYEMESRQYDGSTGVLSVLRKDKTSDRALVTRQAARIIARDFGLIGTVEGKGDNVTVRFKGSALNPNLDRWVKKGDVFALMRVLAPLRNSTNKAERVDRILDTVVQITDDPKGGVCAGRLVYRARTSPLDNPGIASGFRCIKLGVTTGPIRVRMVDDRGMPHNRTLTVQVHSDKFQTGVSAEEEVLAPDRNGVFVSKKNYENIGFARVISGAQVVARMPIEIYENRLSTIVVGISAAQEEQGNLLFLRGELRRMYEESRLVQMDRYKEVSNLVQTGKNSEALKKASVSRETLEDDIKRLGQQMAELKKEIGSLPVSLEDCQTLANILDARRTALNNLIGQLELSEAIEKDPARVAKQKELQDMSNKSLVLVESNEYAQAIELLKQILEKFGEQPPIRKRLEDLEKAWAVSSPDHQAARDFVYKEWAIVKSVAEIEAKLPTAKAKLAVLVAAKDQLTLLKYRNTMPDVGKVLREAIQALEGSEDNDQRAKLKKVVEDYDKLVQDIETAINKKG